MAKKKYPVKKKKVSNRKTLTTKQKVIHKNKSTGIIENMDSFFEKNAQMLFWIALSVAFIFSLLLFDLKVSMGGDDAAYIIRASDIVNSFKYPDFQGPLYPFLLSPIVAIWGLNLTILKFSSLVFMLLNLAFFYLAFRKRIPQSVLSISFLVIAGNSFLMYFSSQTYSEALFMFLESLLLYVLFKFLDKEKISNRNFVLLGFVLFLMAITKNIGFVASFAVLGYFLLKKEWKNAAFSTISFMLFMGGWELLKRFIWGAKELQMSSQASTLFLKHPYDATQGMESIWGFLQRFIDNSNIYLSKHFFTFLGFRPEITEIIPLLTIFVYALFFMAIYFAFKQNKYLLFVGIYLAFMLGATFFALQTIWEARRLIAPYYMLIFLFLFSGIYSLFKLKKIKSFAFLYPIIALILFVAVYKVSLNKMDKNTVSLRQNLKGNTVYGFTPDWQNYIKMCQWAAQNLPPEAKIGARKPSIAFVNTGRRFYGIYKVPGLPLDSLINKCNRLSTSYLIIEASQWEQKKAMQKYYYEIQQFNIGYLTEFWKQKTSSSADKSVVYEVYEVPEKAKAIFLLIQKSGILTSGNINQFLSERSLIVDRMSNYKVDYIVTDPDDLLQRLYLNNVHYVVLANLRKYEQQKTEFTINTIRRYLFYIQRKYPFKIRQLNKIGNDEEAYLFEIL